MSTKKVYLIHDYISLLLQLILLYFVQTFINISSSNYPNYLFGFLYLPILITCYLSLKHLKTIIIPLILFLCFYISFFIFPFTQAEIACYIIITSILFLLFLKKWNNEFNISYTTPPSLCFILIFTIVSLKPDMRILSLCLGTLFLLVYFLEKYLKNLCSYCNNNAYVDKLPISQIVSINIYSIIVFIFCCIAIFFLIKIFHIDSFLYSIFAPILNKIKLGLISILNEIISSLSSENTGKVSANLDNNSTTNFDFGTNSNDNPSLFWRIVSFLSNLLYIIVIAFMIYKLVTFIYNFFATNYKKKMNASDSVIYIKNNNDSLSSTISKKFFKFLKPKNNNSKIRNVFIKYVNSSNIADKNNIETMTAEEICSKLSNNTNKELIHIYEKARYGKTECSKEDLYKIKKYL